MINFQSERIIAAARQVLKAHGYFVDNLWHADDINFICEQEGGEKLPAEDVMTVFEIANEQFDGEHGISWPQLQRALTIYRERQKKKTVPENRPAVLAREAAL